MRFDADRRRGVPLHVIVWAIFLLGGAFSTRAQNPYLSLPDDQPQSALFTGKEWNADALKGEQAFTAKVVTHRMAQTKWVTIYRITFEEVASKLPAGRNIDALMLAATDDAIAIVDVSDPDVSISTLLESEMAPEFEEGTICASSTGNKKLQDGAVETTITTKGDLCTYRRSHESGHFTTMVWRKGSGLVEYAVGSGAKTDGFSLKRPSPAKSKTKR
jgi:hypothetical protein